MGGTEQGAGSGPAGRRNSTVRRRIGASILLVAVLAVALFAVPLGFAASRIDRKSVV